MHSTLMKCIRNVTSVRLYGMPHTCDPPDAVGIAFSADVIKRARQLILVVRDCATSYTTTCLVEGERCRTTGSAMIRLCVELVPLDGPLAVRTYPAPGSTALADDKLLRHHRITIEIGRAKNKNKNPVTEQAIRELEDESLCKHPLDGAVTMLTLAVETARLNDRIRSRCMSTRELLVHRDQFSSQQIPLADRSMVLEQHNANNALTTIRTANVRRLIGCMSFRRPTS